jgi:hypothetical protein
MNRRIRRTVEYNGPDEQVQYLLAHTIGPRGFTAGHVRITEVGIEEMLPEQAMVAFVRDGRHGGNLKENKDKTLTPAEVEVIREALTSMDAQTNETDALLDAIREKLGIENPYKCEIIYEPAAD